MGCPTDMLAVLCLFFFHSFRLNFYICTNNPWKCIWMPFYLFNANKWHIHIQTNVKPKKKKKKKWIHRQCGCYPFGAILWNFHNMRPDNSRKRPDKRKEYKKDDNEYSRIRKVNQYERTIEILLYTVSDTKTSNQKNISHILRLAVLCFTPYCVYKLWWEKRKPNNICNMTMCSWASARERKCMCCLNPNFAAAYSMNSFA